jgi:glutaminyl-tRNA synthetase
VRLKYAYIIHCDEVIRDEHSGAVRELRCTYDPETRSGMVGSRRKVKGTIHWVSIKDAVKAEIRLYDRLFNVEEPAGMKDGSHFTDHINPDSLRVIENAFIEPGIAGAGHLDKFQFERNGYFCVDPDSTEGKIVLNRTVTLRDTWAKMKHD